jgi:two-component system, NtrC family, response regulator HydG
MTILVIDDDVSTCRFLEAAIVAAGHTCRTAHTLAQAQASLAELEPQLALIDLYLNEGSGLEVLRVMRKDYSSCAVVMMTAHASVETVAGSLQHGADEYLGKPIRLGDLLPLIRRFEKRETEERPEVIPSVPSAIIGSSQPMLEVYRLIARVAPSDASVFLMGPSGSGKELVARAIHTHSLRSRSLFTPVNCGALPEQILENELFGHERGAFTGADTVTFGLFEASKGGTIFLDEITETSLAFQVKLLRVLQEGEIRRLGSNKTIDVNVRVIAATNKALGPLVSSGQFREDLYYRLGVVIITLPSLADRREDIPLLAQYFLRKANESYKRKTFLTNEALQSLTESAWPGNVRELENFVNRLVIFAITDEIGAQDVERVRASAGNTIQVADPFLMTLKDVERDQIIRVLRETGGNRSLTAKRLGIERKTLYMKAKRLGIDLTV